MNESEVLDAHRQELRRGSVVLASLLALREPGYGYGLLDVLERAGVPVAANTLYPLLRRLESQSLLTSEWDTTQSRPRKIYRTSDDGIRLAEALQSEWQTIGAALARLDPETLDPKPLDPTSLVPRTTEGQKP
ncbi:PadR family transcriptional regulator [Streptomyces sp. 150FB]|uniref:PadR family transcriptional regulator n=1 Tax=Streptomyces sp. 150FB TaxID=1576605 RepID=UPI00069885E8|nr:PadR family transcriptional regulator [Streptomyces sp. 150FB]